MKINLSKKVMESVSRSSSISPYAVFSEYIAKAADAIRVVADEVERVSGTSVKFSERVMTYEVSGGGGQAIYLLPQTSAVSSYRYDLRSRESEFYMIFAYNVNFDLLEYSRVTFAVRDHKSQRSTWESSWSAVSSQLPEFSNMRVHRDGPRGWIEVSLIFKTSSFTPKIEISPEEFVRGVADLVELDESSDMGAHYEILHLVDLYPKNYQELLVEDFSGNYSVRTALYKVGVLSRRSVEHD